jgi:hypothetical protein
MESTRWWIAIDSRAGPANASDPMRLSSESRSKETDQRKAQNEKHNGPRISTLRGVVFEWGAESVNARDSIRLSHKSLSNEADESDLQSEKPPSFRRPGPPPLSMNAQDCSIASCPREIKLPK